MIDWQKLPTSWNLGLMYSGLNDPKIDQDTEAYSAAMKAFADKWQADKSYLTDDAKLKEALDDYEALLGEFGELLPAYYVYLASKLEENNAEYKGRLEKMADVEKAAMDQIRFFEISLGKVDKDLQTQFLQSENLQPYKHYLERIFINAKYILSEAEERIITEYSGPIYAWGKMRNSLLSGEVIEFNHPKEGIKKLSYGELMDLFNDQDKQVRDLAASEFEKFMAKFAPIMEHELNALLQAKKASDKLRGFEFPSQSRHVDDDIETEVVQALQKSVTANFDIPARFYKLKSKLLKLPKIGYHERNVAIELGGKEKEYTYPDSIKLVHETFVELDPEFGDIVLDFAQNGRIDVFPRLNRYDGAFCIHGAKTQPFFVLLGHANKLRDVSTLAHELGHAANNVYMAKAQNALNFGSPTSTAEVASTFMEDFVLDKLLADASPETQFEILMSKLHDEMSSIFRQVACYNFEEELHSQFREKGYLSKDQIGEIFKKHMSAYMGDFVDQNYGAENWWVYWSHIRNYFYNYSYASGLIISKALQAKVKADKSAITQVKEFLAAGTSASPSNIFKNIGIDITQASFWDEGIEQVRTNLEKAEELAKQLKLI